MAYARPTLTELITRVEADLISRLQIVSTVLRRAFVRIVARVFAGGIYGVHGHVEWSTRQLFASTADSEYLDLHGAELSIARKLATYASGPVTISGTNGVGVPAGTRFTRSDGVTYVVTSGAGISGGTATVTAKAESFGSTGNAAAGVSLAFVSPIAGVNSAAVVASGGITNGIDVEKDDDYRARILLRKQNQPQGGAVTDYEQWALEVAGVTRAWPFANFGGSGNVGVTFVMDNEPGSIIPNGAKVSEVQAYIDDPSRRPVTATVSVYAPTAVPLNFTIAVVPNTPEVKAAVQAELEDLLVREGEPASTLLLTHIAAAISSAAGETNHILSVPAADITYTNTQIPVMGTITWA